MKAVLTTLAEYEKMSPYAQGYVVYMEASCPGSELKKLQNPYEPGTTARHQWDRGQASAVLVVQDLDD